MAEFEHRKSLYREFMRAVLTDVDLSRLARLIRDPSDEAGFRITMESADSEDTYQTFDPGSFGDDAPPTCVNQVRISGYRSIHGLSVDLNIILGSSRSITLRASSSKGTEAAGIFRELERELVARQVRQQRLPKFAHGFLAVLLLAVVASAAVYEVFSIALRFAMAKSPGFTDSQLRQVIRFVGWSCVALAFFGGGVLLQSLVVKIWPPVRVEGHIRDPYTERERNAVAVGDSASSRARRDSEPSDSTASTRLSLGLTCVL